MTRAHLIEQGLGLGRRLLRFALELAETMRDQVGCVGLMVDAFARPHPP